MRFGIGSRSRQRRYVSAHAKGRTYRKRCWLVAIALATLLMAIGLDYAVTLRTQPQAIFVLGGDPARESAAAQLALTHPQLPVWISSGSDPDTAIAIFSELGVSLDRLHLDYRAVDTVTNFTTLADDFQRQSINSLWVLTSDYHIRRARVIAKIVLRSRGIRFRMLAVPAQRSPESLLRVIRDGVRSIVWLATGHTGATFGQIYRRMEARQR